MLKVALYGGAGSGKSVAAKFFMDLGTPIIDADAVAAALTASDSPLLGQIASAFGSKIIKDNQLDRALLRQIIFSDKRARMQLNDIMHPPIRKELKKRMEGLDAPYCVVVVPLLVEARMTDMIDYIVVIDCPERTQIERIVNRDGLSTDEAAKIVRAQATREQRLEVSHRVIDNSLDMNHLKEQIYSLHKEWIKLKP